MQDEIIHSKEHWINWCEVRLMHDRDFCGDDACNWIANDKYPFRVIWCDAESNGYPHVHYMVENTP